MRSATPRARSFADRARGAAFALLLVASAACGKPSVTYGDPAAAITTTPPTPGSATSRAPARPGTTAPPRTATAALAEVPVIDRVTRARRADVPVVFIPRAGAAITAYSGRDGVARARLAPGVYRVHIPAGCATRLLVTYGSNGGTVGVPEGQTARTPALEVEATRRYWPAGALDQPDPPWQRGTSITVGFRVMDRCTDRYAPNARIDDLRARAIGHIELVRIDRRADAGARAVMVVRCTDAGDGRVELYDPQNQADSVDVLSLSPPPFALQRCRS